MQYFEAFEAFCAAISLQMATIAMKYVAVCSKAGSLARSLEKTRDTVYGFHRLAQLFLLLILMANMDAFRLPLSDATNTNHAYLPAKLRYKHSQTERSQKDPYHVPRRAGSSAIFPASWSPLCSPLPSSSAASSSPIRAGCRENSLVFQSSSPACLRPSSPPASPASHIKTSSNIAIAADGQKTNLQASVLDIVSLCDRVDIVTGETLHIGRKTEAMPFASARDQHIKRVQLPKAAKHASRHHCSVKTLISPENSRLEMHLDVLGQNGMQWEGIKIAKGLVIVEVKPDQEARLGFFSGFEIILKIHSASTTPVGKTAHNSFDLESESSCQDGAAPSSDMIQNTASSVTSLPSVTSSPLSSVVSSPAGDCDGARPNKRRRLFSLPKSHVESSGQSPSPYAHQDDDGYPPESSDEEDGTDAMGKFAACKRRPIFIEMHEAELGVGYSTTRSLAPASQGCSADTQPRCDRIYKLEHGISTSSNPHNERMHKSSSRCTAIPPRVRRHRGMAAVHPERFANGAIRIHREQRAEGRRGKTVRDVLALLTELGHGSAAKAEPGAIRQERKKRVPTSGTVLLQAH